MMGVMNGLFKCRTLGMKAKRILYEGVVVSTVMYDSQLWGLKLQEKNRCSEGVDANVLRWFGHIERMSEDRLTKSIESRSKREQITRETQKFAWMDHLEKGLLGWRMQELWRETGMSGEGLVNELIMTHL